MADVIIKLPVKDGAEAALFGEFLNRFMESRTGDAEVWAADNDAPYLMVHSDPQSDLDLKVLTFQEARVAQAFSSGWAVARARAPLSRAAS